MKLIVNGLKHASVKFISYKQHLNFPRFNIFIWNYKQGTLAESDTS